MEKLNDKFRLPIPSDVMDCVSLGSLSYAHKKSCEVWLRMLPQDENGKSLPFSAKVVEELLKYGFRLCFDDVRNKMIKIGEHNLGKRDFLVVESMHGKKFIIFSCGMSEIYFIGIVAL